jgi:hypothetical protein
MEQQAKENVSEIQDNVENISDRIDNITILLQKARVAYEASDRCSELPLSEIDSSLPDIDLGGISDVSRPYCQKIIKNLEQRLEELESKLSTEQEFKLYIEDQIENGLIFTAQLRPRFEFVVPNTDPRDPDTDNDGFGSEPGRGDDGDEFYDLPTNPTEADVVQILPATDQKFDSFLSNNKQFFGYAREDEYIRHLVDELNRAMREEFDSDEVNPYFIITKNRRGEFASWEISEDSDSPLSAIVEMNNDLNWPQKRRGADVLSGFSGQRMPQNRLEYTGNQIIDFDPIGITQQFADGAARGSTTIIGITDFEARASLGNTVELLYIHEIGHVLGAKHPRDSTIRDGTSGIMCKYTCPPPKDNIYTTRSFSGPNKERIKHNLPKIAKAASGD